MFPTVIKVLRYFLLVFIVFVATACGHKNDPHQLSKEDHLARVTPSENSGGFDSGYLGKLKTSCLLEIIKNDIEHVFYTVNPDGKFTEVVMYPQEKTMPCFVEYAQKTTITDPGLVKDKPVHLHIDLSTKPTISVSK